MLLVVSHLRRTAAAPVPYSCWAQYVATEPCALLINVSVAPTPWLCCVISNGNVIAWGYQVSQNFGM